jgi:ubiquinone/menaquinone biosynthesis C-methylase UbiE
MGFTIHAFEVIHAMEKNTSEDINYKKAEIQEYYRVRAGSGRYATSPDFNLREVEIDYLSRRMNDGLHILDAGCGNGYSTLSFATQYKSHFVGVDFVPEMIDQAKVLAKDFQLKSEIEFRIGDVTKLEFPDSSFDIVITERCLLNLPTKKDQWQAIREVSRVVKPGGLYLMLEGTIQGLQRLNDVRGRFNLDPIIEADPKYNWFSNKFDENEMVPIALQSFTKLELIQRFGMYYFISRVLYPLLVKPDQPKYDAPINMIARQICKQYPSFEDIGHVALFIFRR